MNCASSPTETWHEVDVVAEAGGYGAIDLYLECTACEWALEVPRRTGLTDLLVAVTEHQLARRLEAVS